MLDVTTNQPKSSKAYPKEKQRDNASCSKAKSVPESERKEEVNTDVGCGLPKTSSVDELIQVKDMTAENHTVYLDVSGPEVPILYNPWLQTTLSSNVNSKDFYVHRSYTPHFNRQENWIRKSGV